MKLDEAQRKQVAAWITEGLKLAEIQKRMDAELGLRLTYMDVRFLVDDLKLTPKDPEPPKPAVSRVTADAIAPAATQQAVTPPAPPSAPGLGGNVSVTVDQIARPGSLVSGKVTFTDGNKADWQLDQAGRLGLVTQPPGYRPATGDVQQFQAVLEAELAKLGF